MPKTEIKFSWVYNNRENNGNFSVKDLEELKIKCGDFLNLYNKNIKKILQLIEKYSGMPWKIEYIPIWIVKTNNRSFSDPLTLKYRDNKEAMLIVLIHELVHNNLGGVQFRWDYEKNEQYVNLVTKHVAIDIGIDLTNAPMKNFDDVKKLNFNLDNKPLKEFLK